jgi:photosystem II stability/assembly factor-like uncharacterized protein
MRHRRLAVAMLAAAGALAVFISSGTAAVNVAQSGWSWGNPTPQGNTLKAIDFVSGRGYAAGDAGTVLRTDDGGSTWTGLATGTPADLGRLQVIDPETLVVLGTNGCVLRRSDDGGQTFHKIFIVAEVNCPAPVQAFTFVDKQVGYLLQQDGSVLRTTDGGQTFSRQTAVPGTEASNNPIAGSKAVDVAFTGPDTGLVFITPAGGGPSVEYSTTDAGISWKPVEGIDPGSVRRVVFLDATNGYAVGSGTLLKTDDGGKTWKAQPAGTGRDLTSIDCADLKTCLLTTTKGDVLLRTADGGATATEITPSSQPIYAAGFASATRVSAVGFSGATVVSDDGGVNYTPISHAIGGSYTSLRGGPSASSALAIGTRGALALTSDAGRTWTTLAVPTSSDLIDSVFATPGTGYALDARGGLFKTSNAGTTWQTLDTGTTVAPQALAAPAPDVVVLVGPRGIRRGKGSGQPQAVGGRAVSKATLRWVNTRPRLLVASGPGGKAVFLSRDSGSTWTAVKLPKKVRVGASGADFVTSKLGFVVDSRTRLWKTANGGKSWIQLLGTGTGDLFSVSMADARQGFIAVNAFGRNGPGSPAFVMRTSDGGRTWRPQAIARGRTTSVLATGPKQGYAVVDNTELFLTGSGGDAGKPTTLRLKTPLSAITAKALKKAKGRVTVTGSLPGAVGGEEIIVSRRDLNGSSWSSHIVTAGANGGSFTTSWKISRTSVFVAQWAGDSGRTGAGSIPLVVTVKPKPKK